MYRVEKYLDQETIAYTGKPLILSQNRLELNTSGEEILSGAISIAAQTQEPVHCLFYSSHYRMQCMVSELCGVQGELKYQFDGKGLSEGDEVKGEFSIISSAGEYRIPYVVRVENAYRSEKFGSIRNLFHFTNLARENFQEAVEFFYMPQFKQLLTGHDRQYYGLYKGLSATHGNAWNVDQFLVAIHKKQEIAYQVAEEKLILKDVYRQQEESVTLERTGWGYTCVAVETCGGFLACEKTLLTEKDFSDGKCKVLLSVSPEKLRRGYNIGKVVFRYGRQETVCDIVVHMPEQTAKRAAGRSEQKKLVAGLMHQYLSYVTGGQEDCLKEAEKIIQKMNAVGGRNIVARLCQAHVLMALARENEAGWVLGHVENMLEQEDVSDSVYAYYLYLNALLSPGDVYRESLIRLREMAGNGSGNAAAVCFFLRLLPKEEMTAAGRLAVYEEQYDKGITSPAMFYEAWRILEESLGYLTKLGDFEIALIRFAMRYGLFTTDVARQVNDLAKRKKGMSRALFAMLTESYRILPSDDTLYIICTLLIRSGLSGKECFAWYEDALRKDLRITSLFEYYMLAEDETEQKLPPRSVLMYFSYSCNLPDQKKASLYSRVISHEKEISQIFRQYEEQIITFGWQQMEKHVISEEHAVIYRYLLQKQDGLEKAKDHLMWIGFMHKICVSAEGMANVVVIHDQMDRQQVCPIEKGAAFVHCFTERYTVTLEDTEGNRYFDPAMWTDKKLMKTERIALFLHQQKEQSISFLLYQSCLKEDGTLSEQDTRELCEKLAVSNEIEEDMRRKLLNRLLTYYDEKEMTEPLLHILSIYPTEKIGQKEKGQLVRCHIACEQDEKAFELLYEYGFEGVPAKTLARLLGRHLRPEDGCDARLLALTYYCFKQGKYTEEMLAYLGMFYEGDIKQMRDVWKAASDFDVNAVMLAERILLIHLFGNGFISQLEQVFDYYASHGGRESVLKRYVSRHAYAYFVWQQEPQKRVFEQLERYLLQKCQMDEISRFAYLYEMAQRRGPYTKEQETLITRLVKEFVFQKQYVPFFAAFLSFIPWLSLYSQFTYIEYRTRPGTKVFLHYMFDEEDSYRSEPMAEVAGGYYCKSFLMLFSEKLRYYFVEQDGAEENLTESCVVEKSDMVGMESGGRFGLLNDMMLSHSMGDEKTAETLTREYLYESYLHEILGGSMQWK